MKKGLILPILAAALFVGACEEDSDPITTTTQANVRFVNAITDLSGNLAFTAGGTMAGSALARGAVSAQCVRLNSATAVPIAFGTANTGGTGIQGTALTTANQNLTAGGNFAVVAAGTTASPQLFFLNNTGFTGTLGANQAAVRFINFVPLNGGAASEPVDVFVGTGTTATASALAFGGTPTTFNAVTSGNNTFTFRTAGTTADLVTNASVNLAAGTQNTIAIIPDATATGGFRLINIANC